MKIFVGIAVYDGVVAGTLSSLLQSFVAFQGSGDSVHFRVTGSDALISRARSILASQFLLTDCEVLFTLDSDIVFPPDAISRVCRKALETGQIVAGLYTTRGSEVRIALRVPEGKHQFPTDELIEAEYVNTGFMAVPRKVLEDMVPTLEKVHLKDDWMCPGGWWPFYAPFVHKGLYLSEDWAMCERAIRLGYKCYVDNSIVLGHVGTKVYKLQDTATEPVLDPKEWHDATEPWVTDVIAKMVKSLPDAKLYVEIGCLHGWTVEKVLDENPTVEAIGIDIQPIPLERVRFRPIQGDSRKVLWGLDGVEPDVVFVDGGHDYETASNDIRWAQERGARLIIVHDIYSFAGVGQAVREATRDGWSMVEMPVRQFPWYGQTGLALMTRTPCPDTASFAVGDLDIAED